MPPKPTQLAPPFQATPKQNELAAAWHDPTVRVVTCCEFGKISTLAAATLQSMGFGRAVALDGGIRMWREAGYPVA